MTVTIEGKMREVVLDTETTGLDPAEGHRLVEIGCIELFNRIPTGREFHCYINPDRDMPPEAEAVHGLSASFLAKFPLFGDHIESFLEFIGDAPLIIHNAGFDLKFLNAELGTHSRPLFATDRAIDTLSLARRKFPGAPASLDALCKRFNIDTSRRDKHGALIDATLLAAVYVELIGGKEPGLDLMAGATSAGANRLAAHRTPRPQRPARSFPVVAEEQAAHQSFIARIKNALWLTVTK